MIVFDLTYITVSWITLLFFFYFFLHSFFTKHTGTHAKKILKRAVRCFQTQLVSPQALLLHRACMLHNRWALKFLLDIGGLKVVDQIQTLVDSYPHSEEEIRLEEQLETMSELEFDLPGDACTLLSLEQRLGQHAILRKEMIALLLHSKQKALCQKESARQRKLRSTSLVLSSTPPPKKKKIPKQLASSLALVLASSSGGSGTVVEEDDLLVVDDLHVADGTCIIGMKKTPSTPTQRTMSVPPNAPKKKSAATLEYASGGDSAFD